jgi:hypothetical protein
MNHTQHLTAYIGQCCVHLPRLHLTAPDALAPALATQVLGRPPVPASLAVLLAALEGQDMSGQQLLELSGLLALQRVRPPAGLLRQLAEATGPELPRMEGPLLVSLAWTFAELRVRAAGCCVCCCVLCVAMSAVRPVWSHVPLCHVAWSCCLLHCEAGRGGASGPVWDVCSSKVPHATCLLPLATCHCPPEAMLTPPRPAPHRSYPPGTGCPATWPPHRPRCPSCPWPASPAWPAPW